MSKVKIKIVKIDSINEGQTETLADCGFSVGDEVMADLYSDCSANVSSDDFRGAMWSGYIELYASEFEVVQ